jgi:hypothetical protein
MRLYFISNLICSKYTTKGDIHTVLWYREVKTM